MGLLLTVLSGFVLAVFAPALYRVLGQRTGYLIAALPLAIFCYLATFIGEVSAERSVDFQWAWVEPIDLAVSLHLDGLSLLFGLLISGIGVLVCLYTQSYFGGKKQIGVFYAYILIFMAAMLGLVLARNLLVLYVFWELTSLSSFLLIGFDHERKEARAAALQSLLVTAFGGLSLLAGVVLLGLVGGSFELPELLPRADAIQQHSLYPAILILIALGAFTKSAQFPFHFWLPGAMEAPTPVSAYLHSATMVKAGVYLLARLLPMLGGEPLWSGLITTVGALTMLVGAIWAFFDHDLKGILAYLTINVLGTLVMLLGLGTPLAIKAAMTYLLAHAFYKGALFLIAGVVDHETHRRDIRQLRGLRRGMPISAAIALLAALSMAGILPLFGFIAKELFLEAVWKAPVAEQWLVAASLIASSFLVAGAGLAGIHPFFFADAMEPAETHEGPVGMLLSPALLAGLGLVVGLFPKATVQTLIEGAASATHHSQLTVDLALWHGVKPPLILSLIVLAVGAGLYILRERLLALELLPRAIRHWSGSSVYEWLMAALNHLAMWQTRILQSGYLRRYVLTILLVLLLLLLPLVPKLHWHSSTADVRVHEAIAVLLIIAAALVTIVALSRLHAIVALGMVGFSVAWIFSLFGAPDLAMTQVVIESLTVLLLVLAFFRLPQFSHLSKRSTRLRDLLVAGMAGATVTALLLVVSNSEHHTPISDYYAEASYLKGHGRNVVNVILVDFRALDTMGEVTVLATAAVGVLALIKLMRRKYA